MKKCPFCSEKIHLDAIKCRWCGEWLVDRRHLDAQRIERPIDQVDLAKIVDRFGDGLLEAHANFERRYILRALEKANWNQTEAARILKIHRNTLIQKMKSFNIEEPF